MEVLVLGPLEVRHHGGAMRLPGARPRELLSLLATRPNQPVSPQRLIEELWDGAPPPTAASALRVHIGHVRSILEPGRPDGRGDRLALVSGGYVLRLDASTLDSLRFEERATAGREADLRGDVHVADDELTAALDCWRGPAFAEIRGLSAAQAAIARLEQLRVRTIEALVDVRLALGKPATVVDLLVSAVDEFPLHERLAAQLMLALYRCGRQADALRACARLAQRLDEQLGVKPCQEVRQLEEDILLQRRHLDVPGRPSRLTVDNGVRAEPTRCIGRRSELDRLIELHDDARSGNRRLALVSGAAGIGKTTLVDEYCGRARRVGASILQARCAAPPSSGYDAIVQLLSAESLTRGPACGHVFEVLSRLRGERGPVTADLPVQGSNDPSDVLQLLESIARVVGSLEAAPIVLVVEDLQWADKATTRVLRHLLRHPTLDSLFVVATYCEEELEADLAERIARLAPPMQVARIELAGFDLYEIRALIRATADPSAVPLLLEIASTVGDATDGNPFYVRALMREFDDAASTGVGREELEEAVATLAPEGVRALLGRRLDRLSPAARDVLNAAATIGHAISVPVLAAVCGLSVEALTEPIEELLAGRLLDEDDWHVDHLELPHALVRNTVYSGLADDERERLHLRVAEVLESLDARRVRSDSRSRVEIAHHYVAALPLADPGTAADHARRAGDEAAERLSFSEAAAWYERARELWISAGRPESATGGLDLALGQAYEADREFTRARAAFAVPRTRSRSATRGCSPILPSPRTGRGRRRSTIEPRRGTCSRPRSWPSERAISDGDAACSRRLPPRSITSIPSARAGSPTKVSSSQPHATTRPA